MSRLYTNKEILDEAIANGAKMAVEYHVYSSSRWHKMSISFFDSEFPNNDDLYRNVGYYSYDIGNFTPHNRMASRSYVETDPKVKELKDSGQKSDKGLFLRNREFDLYLEIQMERQARAEKFSGYMFNKQVEIARQLDLTSPIPFNERNLQRQSVRIFTDSGRVWDTEINGSRESVLNYYLGESFEYDESLTTDTAVLVLFGPQNIPASSFTKEQGLNAIEQWKKGVEELNNGNDLSM